VDERRRDDMVISAPDSLSLTLLCLIGCAVTTLAAVPPSTLGWPLYHRQRLWLRPPMTLVEIPIEIVWESRLGGFTKVIVDEKPGVLVTGVPFVDRVHLPNYIGVTGRAFQVRLARALRECRES
jgi:hypothetical protein